MGEINVYGVYVPIFLVQAILAYILLFLINKVTDRWVESGWIALPGIFNLCLYVILLWFMHWIFILCSI